MRFTFTHLIALFLFAVLSAPSALAAPAVPGIGRHRNPATVSRQSAALAGREAAPEPLEVDIKRTNLDGEFEKRMDERMEGVLGAMGEAKARNEQKKHKRQRMARFHP
ncbi:hypothetical protein CALVIDRAFT_538726 [Calocera viscosa TUFC12733]|uniref:Uncharacterized protein n=1 Tax=Calocera viscosa (strain TUFC12733) TaxID=1330018 RepID=A0A167KFX5_CALVF|nr:hypothetical protein CALVIDRAFT_538726 [Calocera viscosa TUFC12733]